MQNNGREDTLVDFSSLVRAVRRETAEQQPLWLATPSASPLAISTVTLEDSGVRTPWPGCAVAQELATEVETVRERFRQGRLRTRRRTTWGRIVTFLLCCVAMGISIGSMIPV